ncbi:MAG: hypothetical protein HY820_19960 [Acidobacteria bacterium]|nr:hypothetical protein [Acidobacteriota bacterium]
MRHSSALRICALTLAVCLAAPAAVRKIYLVERADIPGYPYERIAAKVHFEIDPKASANRIIRDIDRAPLNENGTVEFAADLFVLKPLHQKEKGNGSILFEVSNRGGKGMLGMFNFATASRTPSTKEDMGDGYLLSQGYTLVWLGWQADVPMDPANLRLFSPVATVNGQTITGPVRAQWVLDRKTTVQSLGDRGTHLPYPVAGGDDPKARLTVQDSASAPRREIPRSEWKFAREEFGKAVPDNGHVYYARGFEPGKIYEVVYQAQDPTIVGLGPTAIRDVISFLKYENDGTMLLGDQRAHLKRAIAVGTSQSGRFLRNFVYEGFNGDEKGRKVFDGVWAHVAGGGRGSFNHRFAQPSRDGHPFLNLLYPTDIYPFTDAAQADPETGLNEGILSRAEAAKVTPKIFYTNGSYEYWGRAASLIHTSIDGKSDSTPAPGTRIYFFTGTQHGAGSFPPRRNNTRYLANPNDYKFLMRGLLAAMNAWLTSGKEPPASQYPLLSQGQLTGLQTLRFPKLNDVDLPKTTQLAWRADYGPEFRSHGIVSNEPPKLGRQFPVPVPQVDADGNETSGIRLPEIQVPLGTYAGWNLRSASIGAPGEYFNMAGSFFPFPKSKAERAKMKDTRMSIEERYAGKDDYLSKIRSAAKSLAQSGYVLEQDIHLLEQRASREWDALAK